MRKTGKQSHVLSFADYSTKTFEHRLCGNPEETYGCPITVLRHDRIEALCKWPSKNCVKKIRNEDV